ncbi:hypothetical protein DFH08DRAFT_884551 [Mycena albidolilacea]|uniref:Uncharacterized protein n=1 Tax=Mycena albidolilacea TaxID=1033008 RepID=A0AAD6ZKF1_9AGAR|nr:hypothetical protein DFH08DRAFT_884551 [Mycena albidolilacea]
MCWRSRDRISERESRRGRVEETRRLSRNMACWTDSLNTPPQRNIHGPPWKVELPREEGYKECDVDDESSCREPKECEGDGKWKECEGKRPNDSMMTVADVLRIFSDRIHEQMTQIGRSSRTIGIAADGRESGTVAYSITGHGTPKGQAPRFFLEGRSPKFDIYRNKHRNGGTRSVTADDRERRGKE